MLGKVRGIAIAIVIMGMVGAYAHAGSFPESIIGFTGNWSDIPGYTTEPADGDVRITNSKLTIDGSPAPLTTGNFYDTGNVIITTSEINLNTKTLEIKIPDGSTLTPYLDFRGRNTVKNGSITANEFTMLVGGDLKLTDDTSPSPANIAVKELRQSDGTISGAADTQIITSGKASISGPNSVYAVSGNFGGGALFENGAILRGSNNTITAADTKFRNAQIDLTENDLTINGTVTFDNASTLTLGADTTDSINQLKVNSISSNNLANIVRLDSSYSKHYYNAVSAGPTEKFIIGTVEGKNQWTVRNVFGDFTFKYDSSSSDGAWLEAYKKTEVSDINAVSQQLGYTWDSRIITPGIASNVSIVAHNIVYDDFGPDTLGAAGRFNYGILEAMANGNRSVDKALISAMNGSNLAGVNYVAQDVARDIFTTLHSRLEAYRAVAVDIASDTALGSVATVADQLNDRYLNRFWAGGIGSWSNARERKGFDGYKYDGKGIVLGYDRAVCAAIFGLAGAYIEGDYEDKGASGHDSKIKNYALNAYMTYSASSGFFTTLSGGWVYSDDDIRERRGGLWSREDYHTNTWHAEARLGYDIQPCDNWSVSPSIGVNFFHAKASAHDLEIEGGPGAVYSYSSAKNHMVEIPVEIQAAYEMPVNDLTRVTFMANGGYAYNLNDHAIRGQSVVNGIPGATPSQIVGRKLGHNSWKAGVGVNIRHDQWDLGVKYDYYGRDKYHNHRIMGSIGYSF